MKFFRSKQPELSRGYWKEKVSELFGQTAHFPPVGSEGKKKAPGFVKTASSPPEDGEGRYFQNPSFKTGKILQWVVERKISEKYGPL